MFPVITKKIQKQFEENCSGENPSSLPLICGIFGRACRQMGKNEGANRFLCTNCPLAKFSGNI